MSQDKPSNSSDCQRSQLTRPHQGPRNRPTTFTPLVLVSKPHTPIPSAGAATWRLRQDPVTEHELRSQRYYDTQVLRPSVPVVPRPTAEDMARRSRKCGVRPVRVGPPSQKKPDWRDLGIADLEEITSTLAREPSLLSHVDASGEFCKPQKRCEGTGASDHATTNERPDEGDLHPSWTCDETIDEEQSSSEDFVLVEYEVEFEEDFEEVDRDMPTAFNGRIPYGQQHRWD